MSDYSDNDIYYEESEEEENEETEDDSSDVSKNKMLITNMTAKQIKEYLKKMDDEEKKGKGENTKKELNKGKRKKRLKLETTNEDNIKLKNIKEENNNNNNNNIEYGFFINEMIENQKNLNISIKNLYYIRNRFKNKLTTEEVKERYILYKDIIKRWGLDSELIEDKINLFNVLEIIDKVKEYNDKILIYDKEEIKNRYFIESNNSCFVNYTNNMSYISTLGGNLDEERKYTYYSINIFNNNYGIKGIGEILKDFLNNRYKILNYYGYNSEAFNVEDLEITVLLRVYLNGKEEYRVINKKAMGSNFNTARDTYKNLTERFEKVKNSTDKVIDYINYSDSATNGYKIIDPNMLSIKIYDKNFNENLIIEKEEEKEGGGGGGGIRIRKNRYYKSKNYNNDKGLKNNCWLHIFNFDKKQELGIKKLPTKYSSTQIRREVGLSKDDELPTSKLHLLEPIYERNIEWLEAKPKIIKTVKSKGTYKDTIIESQMIDILHKSNSNYEKTIRLVLDYDFKTRKGHYSHYIKHRNILYCNKCGEFIKEKEIHSNINCLDTMKNEGYIDEKEYKKTINKWKYQELIKEKEEKKKRNIIDKRPFKYLFFDIEDIHETYDEIVDKKRRIVYANYYLHCKDENEEIIEGLNAKFETGKDVIKHFVDFLLKSKERYLIISYNGSRFDCYPLIKELVKRNVKFKPNQLLIANNKLLHMEFNGHKIFDLCLFVKSKLKNACIQFKTNNKKQKGFDHLLVQKIYDETEKIETDSFFKWLKLNNKYSENYEEYFNSIKENIGDEKYSIFKTFTKEKLKEYNEKDVLALKDLFFTFKNNFQKDTEGIFNKVGGYDITEYYTLAHMANTIFMDSIANPNIKKQDPQPIYLPSQLINKINRGSLYGGRSQCYKRKKYVNCDLVYIDATSLYPYVCLFYLYPTECNPVFTDKYIEPIYDKEGREIQNTGFYYCRFSQKDLLYKIIPYRDDNIKYKERVKQVKKLIEDYFNKTISEKDLNILNDILNENNFDCFQNIQSLNWTYDGYITTYLNTVDITQLKNNNVSVEILPLPDIPQYVGYYFPCENKPIFHDFINLFKDKKINQDNWKNKNHQLHHLYNPALRNIYKLILNALTGRLGMNNYNDTWILTDNVKDIENFTKTNSYVERHLIYGNTFLILGEKYKDNETFKPSHLLSLIYSYSRKHMYNKIYKVIIEQKGKIIYTDTDSCIFKRKYLKQIEDNGDIGNDFGYFKPELSGEIIPPKDIQGNDIYYKEGIIRNGTVAFCNISQATFIKSKNYYLYDTYPFDDGSFKDRMTHHKIVFAGFNKNNVFFRYNGKLNIDKLKFEDLDIVPFNHKLFDDIYYNNNIYAICDNIKKVLINTSAKTSSIGDLFGFRIIKKVGSLSCPYIL